MTHINPTSIRPWNDHPEDRVVGRGHPIGDFLEAWRWEVLERDNGRVRISAHLPETVLNPRGELFGGFSPAYVDFVSLHAVKAKTDQVDNPSRLGLTTLAMRVDYLEPVTGPNFILDSRVEASRGLTDHVLTKFLVDDTVAVIATTTMRTLMRT